MGLPINMDQKGWKSIECWTYVVTFNVHLTHDLDLVFWKSRISGMGLPTDMERKGCESIECWVHVVTVNVHLTHDLDLGFSRSDF